jgi:ribosomal protein S18 acetylase RimI-like enzyme
MADAATAKRMDDIASTVAGGPVAAPAAGGGVSSRLSVSALLRAFQSAQARRMECYARFRAAFVTFMSEREAWEEQQVLQQERRAKESTLLLKGGDTTPASTAAGHSSTDDASAPQPKTLADMREASEAQERALSVSPEQVFQRVCIEVMAEFQAVSKQVRAVIDAFLQQALAAVTASTSAAANPSAAAAALSSPTAGASARHWSSRLQALQQLEKLKLELTIHQQMLRNSAYVRAHPAQHGQVHEHHHHHPHYAHTDARGRLKALAPGNKKKKKARTQQPPNGLERVSEDGVDEGGEEHKHADGEPHTHAHSDDDDASGDDDEQEFADNAQPFTRHLSALLSDSAHQNDSPFLFPPSEAFPRTKEQLAAIAAAPPSAAAASSSCAGGQGPVSAEEIARGEEELAELRAQEHAVLQSINDILEEVREEIMDAEEEEEDGEEDEEGATAAAAAAAAASSSVARQPSSSSSSSVSHVRVRVPIVSDADAIGRTHVRAWQGGYADLMDRTWLAELSIPDRQAKWRRRIQAATGVEDPALMPKEAEFEGRSLAFFVAEMPAAGAVVVPAAVAAASAAASASASGSAALPGEVVGFITAGPLDVFAGERQAAPERSGEITGLNVAPEGWGTGAAQALMRAALRTLRHGPGQFEHAILWVTQGNVRAQRFYEKEGFVLDGERREDQRGGHAFVALRMRRSLHDIPEKE